MSKFYCGTDVHSYTLDLRSRSNEFSEFWKKPMNRESVTAKNLQMAFARRQINANEIGGKPKPL